MRPALSCILFVFLAGFADFAHAHSDTILPIKTDGAIPDIPSSFGPVLLKVEGLGTAQPQVRLQVGAHQTTLPQCAARLIRTTDFADVQASGSWYHDERAGLPSYIGITFFDPGRKSRRAFNSSVKFLFNLHDASLISAKLLKVTEDGTSGQYNRINVAADCTE